MFDIVNFINSDKILLVAPAGYGKTHIISECINFTPDNETQLILTHTHAGIASIKQKLKKLNVPSCKFHVETIMGFVQKYVLAYFIGTVPEIDDREVDYYDFILNEGIKLFGLKSVQKVVSISYQGLFVDEYQDCTIAQHKLIMQLSKLFPTRILGDPLQGIMNFNGDLVDFENDLDDFTIAPELNTPHRWFTNDNNRELGITLKDIRKTLLKEDQIVIKLSGYEHKILYYINVKDGDIYDPSSNYRKGLNKLISNPDNKEEFESLLILMPEYTEDGRKRGNVRERAKLKERIDYSKKLSLIEAIDDKTFYSLAKKIDFLVESIQRSKKKTKKIKLEIIDPIFNKTQITKWFSSRTDELTKKTANSAEAEQSQCLQNKIDEFIETPSVSNVLELILFLKNEMKFKSKRQEVLGSLIQAMKTAIIEEVSVYEGMISHRNIIRKVGRKVIGKCIGTTSLTKGLEFDTVAIMDAHKFDCPKHLYVALTRASKKLIIFSQSEQITFNQ
jgi:DNA helicase-2/ATP-dependent DNA helicase PcrA